MRTFYIILATSLMLIVGGFIVPPVGVIDGSVLTAVGLLLMFAALAQIPTIIEAANNGKSIKLSKGDFEVQVSADKE